MSYTFLARIIRMIVVLFIQILIFNNIHIAGYITPLFIGYMLIPFNKGAGRIELLIWGFITGLIFDMFSNTAGMGAASCTLLAMLQPGLVNLFTPRDAADNFTPGFRTMGVWGFTCYCLLSMLVLHGLFYALDAFMLQDWLLTLIAIAGGSLATMVLCIVAELAIKSKD